MQEMQAQVQLQVQVQAQVHEDGFWCNLEFVDNFGFGEGGGLLEGSLME